MITNIKAGMQAVAYYRMSSKKQDKSIPAQRSEVEKYALANGYTIIRWEPYVDEGISGSESEKREGFQRLMRDATERSDFEVILCWDQDRFSRFDALEANHYWYMLRQVGVRIVTVRQGELDLAELGGWLVASITQHGKAQYLKDLSANVLRGRLRKAEKGLWAGSRAAYGYAMTADSRLILGDHEQVAAVKFIFKTYAERDISLRTIAEMLNEQGVPAPNDGTWTGAKVCAILRRKNYLGKAFQFRESKGKFCTIRDRGVAVAAATGTTRKAAKDWFSVDCPQIVSQDMWNQCQAKRKRRQTRTSPPNTKGLLNGLLYCGHCGERMFANGKITDGSGGPTFCCSTYNTFGVKNAQGKGCQRNLIHQSALLPFLMEKIQELILAPANLDRVRTEIERQLGQQHEVPSTEAPRLRAKIAKLDKDIKAAAAELKRTPDDLYELAVEDMRGLRADRERASTTLEALESVVPRAKASASKKADAAIAAVHKLDKGLHAADPSIVREALNQVLERIDVWFDHQHSAKRTRSYFCRGIVRLRKPTPLFRHTSRLR